MNDQVMFKVVILIYNYDAVSSVNYISTNEQIE